MSQCIILLLLTWTLAEHTSALTLFKNSQDLEENEWEEACRNETYCTIQSKNYPKQKIEMLLNDMDIRTPSIMSGSRRGRSNSEYYFQVCSSDINISPIYEIIDSNGKVRYVVQSEKYFQQVRIEKCRNPGIVTESDDYFFNLEDQLFDLFCKEKRVNYSFMVLSEDESQFEWASVANGLPILCYCHMEIKS
ncbi:hypothetical protein K1T71_005764 [Dendrolimus kikuchii]|uniref:Uncharacterized protein n=1 Tax=Dendrolimus kikuchii TaxID=765133 RepID=A0ACC1D5H6_9NEOP|nr:hypothetical protein K1T71_005764 [Dendrolimus kikuchii]